MKLSDNPIIIFGAPRSGTTYLNNLLNAHPEVHVSHETRLFAWAHETFIVSTAKDRLLVSYRDQFIEHLRSELPQLIREFHAKQWPHTQYWGDKNPHYADPANLGCLETIRELFPGTRFLHIVRDGRDVVASLVRKRHADGQPWVDLPTACEVWRSHVAIGTAFGRSVDPRTFFELRYEDLVEDDRGYAERIFQFLEIPIHETVLSFCEDQRRQRTGFSGPTRNLQAGVAASDWSEALTPGEQAVCLPKLLPGLREYRYETLETAAES